MRGEEGGGDEILRPPRVEMGAGPGPLPVYWGDNLVRAGFCHICVCCDGDSRSSSGPPPRRVQRPELCLRCPRIPDGTVRRAGCSSCGGRNADREVEGDALRRSEPPLSHLGGLVVDLRLCPPVQPRVLQTLDVVLVLCSNIEQVRRA